MKFISLILFGTVLVALSEFADATSEGINKHITQVCLAYNGVEGVGTRHILSVKLDGETNEKQTIVLFDVEFIDGGNFDYQFISVMNSFDTPNGVRPIFFEKIGGKGIRCIESMAKSGDGVLLTGMEYGPNDPMSTPSVPCAFRLRSEDGVITLKKVKTKN